MSQKRKMILKYYGHKILIKHCNTAKRPNNLANAVFQLFLVGLVLTDLDCCIPVLR